MFDVFYLLYYFKDWLLGLFLHVVVPSIFWQSLYESNKGIFSHCINKSVEEVAAMYPCLVKGRKLLPLFSIKTQSNLYWPLCLEYLPV